MANRKAYRKIAKKYGVKVAEVKAEMNQAIRRAAERGNMAGLKCPGNAIPTSDEFIAYAVNKIKNDK